MRPASPATQQGLAQHIENVDQGSTIDFDVKLRHRFEGGVTAEIVTELIAGDKSLDPQSLPSGAGTLTYVAPDENDKDATAQLISTSNRGIGTLLLTFHTATQLQVNISDTETFDEIIRSR